VKLFLKTSTSLPAVETFVMRELRSEKTFSLREVNFQGLIWAVVFEILTCVLRFGFALESTRDTASSIGRLTMGMRIHHSYIGIACVGLAFWLEQRFPKSSFHLLAIGIGLFISDMIHHFVVLWIITGNPQFDLLY
jgi:hypothetical protein